MTRKELLQSSKFFLLLSIMFLNFIFFLNFTFDFTLLPFIKNLLYFMYPIVLLLCNALIIYIVFKKASKSLKDRKQWLRLLKLMVLFCIAFDGALMVWINIDRSVNQSEYDTKGIKDCDLICQLMRVMYIRYDNPLAVAFSVIYLCECFIFCFLAQKIKNKAL